MKLLLTRPRCVRRTVLIALVAMLALLAIPAQAVAAEGNGSFAVQVLSHGAWTTVGSASFGAQYTSATIDLPGAYDAVRLVQSGGMAAQLDAALLGGQAPHGVEASADPLAARKLAAIDNDVTNVFETAIVLSFPAPASALELNGRVQGSLAGAWPFEYPVANAFKAITADSAFYPFAPGSGGAAPLVREFANPGTGHPAGYTYVWAADDAENLLVTIDFTSDNTMDGDDDYASVHVKTAAGVKDFTVSAADCTWGAVDFTYTDKVSYQHKLYTFSIPWSELGGRAEVGLAFTAYGTAAQYPIVWAPVYRFYNATAATHFYTVSAEESTAVQQKWPNIFSYEGVAFFTVASVIDPQYAPYVSPLYRFYNKKNGSHFYTISAEEKEFVEARYADTFAYEGPAFNVFNGAPNTFGPPILPVYRFYNRVNGSHFYTISEEEKSLVLFLWGTTYKYEGIAFYASPYNYSVN